MCIQSQYSTSYIVNGIEDVLANQKMVMVPHNHQNRQSSFLKIKAQQVKTYEGDLQKLGHPADCNHKRNSSGKKQG